MTGFINVIKPEGISSARAVTSVKKKFNLPCGHMGTLDPMASGVLPVGIGKASRLFQYMLEKEKTYVADFTFGEQTDTLDKTGKIELSGGKIPSKEEIKKVLPEFLGNISQIPPKYSAKCINGKRGYQLARRGVEFELPPKTVFIKEFSLTEKTGDDTYRFMIRCGGGTYIRALCRDLAQRLETYAYMSKLDRIKAGVFDYTNGVPLSEFENCLNPEKYLIPAEECVSFKKLTLNGEQAKKLLDGLYEKYGFSDGIYRVYSGTEFFGVGEVKDGVLKMKSYVR